MTPAASAVASPPKSINGSFGAGAAGGSAVPPPRAGHFIRPPPPPTPSAADRDKKISRGFLHVTLAALGLLAGAPDAGVTLPSHHHRHGAISRRRAYAFGPPELAHTEVLEGERAARRPRERDTRAAQLQLMPKPKGLSTAEQHRILRRLQYVRPTAAVDDLALHTPYTPSTAHSTPRASVSGDHHPCESSPRQQRGLARAPSDASLTSTSTAGVSAYAPRSEREAAWVRTLAPIDPAEVRFPEASTECHVCLRRFRSGEDVAELPCGHFFHFYCVMRWFRSSAQCPFCRQSVLPKAAGGEKADGDAAAAPELQQRQRSSSAPLSDPILMYH